MFVEVGIADGSMKTKTAIDARLCALVEPIAEDLGLEVVRVRLIGAKTPRVQIMTDRIDGSGVSVDDCARLSRAVSATFDVEDPIAGEYHLEVSSPGVDRPLTVRAHIERWTGFEAKLELDRLAEGRRRFTGVLDGLDENGDVLVRLDEETDCAVLPFDWIVDAKLVMTEALLVESLRRQADPDPSDTSAPLSPTPLSQERAP
ncbi:MAG: ribosome maturation factor RimP [Maricaulaceae bacterium]